MKYAKVLAEVFLIIPGAELLLPVALTLPLAGFGG